MEMLTLTCAPGYWQRWRAGFSIFHVAFTSTLQPALPLNSIFTPSSPHPRALYNTIIVFSPQLQKF